MQPPAGSLACIQDCLCNLVGGRISEACLARKANFRLDKPVRLEHKFFAAISAAEIPAINGNYVSLRNWPVSQEGSRLHLAIQGSQLVQSRTSRGEMHYSASLRQRSWKLLPMRLTGERWMGTDLLSRKSVFASMDCRGRKLPARMAGR